uniref:F-box domain-containing protein n=1 Tax=Meloidogyne hapla TaxID=6305 RepID=A0A1I8BSC8_MELHA
MSTNKNLIELPTEILVTIYKCLDNWKDVLANQFVCKHLKQVICENASKFVRPPFAIFIENKTGGISFNNSSCNNEDFTISIQKYNNSNFLQFPVIIVKQNNINSPFDRLQILSLNIKGPITDKQIYCIADRLKTGKQKEIKFICLKNVNF